MAEKIKKPSYQTAGIVSQDMGQVIDDMMKIAKEKRLQFERRWYDNNFFDDGFHFRYLSRTTNKIVDLSERSTIYTPSRAIPKASRQIRGVSNLLVSQDPTPIVYPEKVSKTSYPDLQQIDPNTGQAVLMPNPEYQEALKVAKDIAKKVGFWLTEEFKNQDLAEKLAFMAILAAKHGVSFLEVWPDSIEEKIKTKVYDAFDIHLMGDLTEIYDSPFIIKGVPQLISQIKANKNFDKDQLEKINPDNKGASSEIKEAYVTARFGREISSDQAATLILKEAFIKEYLNSENHSRIKKQEDSEKILKNRDEGDPVIRQVFVAGNIPLKDTYLNLPDYPFVDFRFEPGPIYQVPLIERFIPSNKALDAIVSRVERYAHTMVTGTWLKRSGEQFKINNIAGGQVIEYDATPPVQANIASIPAFVFSFISFLNAVIEEQGVTTSTLGKLPSGVRANAAIESLKESEYSNLVIALRRLKGTVKKIAEKMLDLVDDYFVTPQTVYYLEKGEPQYFDIIGKSALEKRSDLKIETPKGVVPISKDYRVEIEVTSGVAFTKEGQRATAVQLMQIMTPLVTGGFIPPQAFKVFIEKFLETYQFGNIAEFMEAMETAMQEGSLTEQQIMQMKVAVAETLKDTGFRPQPTEEERIQESKVGVAEVLKDLQGGGQ
jgi:hypothetical protein